MNSTMNNSFGPPVTGFVDDPLYSREPWYWFARGIIAIITIFGNGFVLYLISTRIVLREQASPNWFVLSLAVADFCVGFINFPLNVYYAFTVEPGQLPGKHWAVLSFIINISLDASVANLVLLTLDRYLAVVHPFTYESFLTPNVILRLIMCAWGLCTLLEIPYLVLDLQVLATNPESYLIVLVIYMVLMVFLPSFFMIYAYGRIIFVARKHKKKIKEHKRQLASNASIRRRMASDNGNKNGAMVTVGTLVVIFLLSNLVTEYRCVCYLLQPKCQQTAEDSYLLFFLRNLNSAPNFIVYAFMKKDFRRELRKTIRKTFYSR